MAKFSLVYASGVQFCVSGKLLRQFTHNVFPHPRPRFPLEDCPFGKLKKHFGTILMCSEAKGSRVCPSPQARGFRARLDSLSAGPPQGAKTVAVTPATHMAPCGPARKVTALENDDDNSGGQRFTPDDYNKSIEANDGCLAVCLEEIGGWLTLGFLFFLLGVFGGSIYGLIYVIHWMWRHT